MKAAKRRTDRKMQEIAQRLSQIEDNLNGMSARIAQIQADVEEIKEHANRRRRRRSRFSLSGRRRREADAGAVNQPVAETTPPSDATGLLGLAGQLDPATILALLQNPMIQSLLKKLR